MRIGSVGMAGALLIVAAGACARPARESLVQRGQGVFERSGCYSCHTVGRVGTPLAPDLSRIGAKYPADYLARWLRDPAAQRPHANMPALELTDSDIQALAAYLGTLQ